MSVSVSNAQINYTEDFESFAEGPTTAPLGDDWRLFGNIYNPAGGYVSGYGWFPAPNSDNGVSSIIVNGSGKFLKAFANYPDEFNLPSNFLETNIYQERPIAATDAGDYTFSFDHVLADPSVVIDANVTELFAFVRVIDPNVGPIAPILNQKFDVSGINTLTRSSIEVTLDASMAGSFIQWGFASTTGALGTPPFNTTRTCVHYDNLSFALTPEVEEIPTMGQWSLLILGMMMASLGLVYMR